VQSSNQGESGPSSKSGFRDEATRSTVSGNKPVFWTSAHKRAWVCRAARAAIHPGAVRIKCTIKTPYTCPSTDPPQPQSAQISLKRHHGTHPSQPSTAHATAEPGATGGVHTPQNKAPERNTKLQKQQRNTVDRGRPYVFSAVGIGTRATVPVTGPRSHWRTPRR